MRHLVAYHGNRYLDHFRRDLDEMADHGFNGVVHCVTEADIAWSRRRVGEMFTTTREAGFECGADPWGVGGVFGGEAHSGFMARHPDAVQVTDDGSPLPAACLRHPRFRDHMRSWVDAVAEAGAESVFWDEPHLGVPFDSRLSCYCSGCEQERDGTDITAFRVATTLDFLDEMTRYAASMGVRSSACLYPVGPDAATAMGLPSIEDVAALPGVDDIAVDPYPLFVLLEGRTYADFDAERFVGSWADRLRKVAADAGVTCHLWIQGFGLPKGYEHLVVECAAAARAHGIDDLAFWSYRASEAGVAMPSDDPAAAWAAAKLAFRENQ